MKRNKETVDLSQETRLEKMLGDIANKRGIFINDFKVFSVLSLPANYHDLVTVAIDYHFSRISLNDRPDANTDRQLQLRALDACQEKLRMKVEETLDEGKNSQLVIDSIVDGFSLPVAAHHVHRGNLIEQGRRVAEELQTLSSEIQLSRLPKSKAEIRFRRA